MQKRVGYGVNDNFNHLRCFEIAMISSFRVAAISGKAGQDPVENITQRLGSRDLASQMAIIVSAIGNAWPDNFSLSRPCCPHLTHDEVTLIGMMRYSGADDRVAYDELLSDMLPRDMRDFLYTLCSRFVSHLSAAQH